MSNCSLKAAQEVKKEIRFVGIDIGKAKCRAAITDPDGLILEEFAFTNKDEQSQTGNITTSITKSYYG